MTIWMKKILSFHHLFDVLLFAFLGVCICLKNEAYAFQPFVIVLLSFSANYCIQAYIASNIGMLLTSFLISTAYGYEIFIIEAMFFVAKVIANLFLTEFKIRLAFPYVITSLMLFTMYFVREPNISNFLNLSGLLLLSFLAFYGFHRGLVTFQHAEKPWATRERIIAFTLFPFLFSGVTLFYYFFVRLFQLLLLKTAQLSEALCSIVLSSILMTYLLNTSEVMILSLLFPFFIALLFPKKYSLYAYFISYLLCEAFLIENFYLQGNFYQGLTAILFVFLLPFPFLKSISYFFGEKEQKEEKSLETIQTILQYLDVVLDSRLEDKTTPLENTVRQLEMDLCYQCEKKEACHLGLIRRKGIEEKLTQEERKTVVNQCRYPYRFFKRVAMMNEFYSREDRKIKEALYHQDLYRKELQNTYTPLKLMEEKKQNTLPEKLMEALQNEGYEVADVREFDTEIELRFLRAEESILYDVIPTLESIYRKSFRMVKSAYSFASGCYFAAYTWEKQYHVQVETFQSSVLKEHSGDHYYFKEDQKDFFLILSDGMGHNESADSLSSYLIESLKAYREIDENFSRQIDTVNRLIYHKSITEMYATLDYFLLDLVKLKFVLFKAGSFPTYIYRNKVLKESKRNFPPLGILSDIEVFAYEDSLQVGDMLIFLTDGFGNDVQEKIEEVLAQKEIWTAEEAKESIMKKLLQDLELIDDRTLIVLKIEKKSDEIH